MRCPAIVVLAAAALNAGCQSKPVNAFHAWETPKETAMIVENDGVYCQIVNTFLIGEDPETDFFDSKDSHTYRIPAGRTKLMVGYEKSAGAGAVSNGLTVFKKQTSIPKELAFTAEPGHTYTFESKLPFFRPTFLGELKNDEWDVRLVDKADQRVVAETRDRETPTTKPSTGVQANSKQQRIRRRSADFSADTAGRNVMLSDVAPAASSAPAPSPGMAGRGLG